MTHEVIRREEARLLRILEEYPVNGRKTNTGTIKMIRKESGAGRTFDPASDIEICEL